MTPFDLEEVRIQCPYCGELITVVPDVYDDFQEYYEDCSVCCAPILFTAVMLEDGSLRVTAKRDDE
ncbi:MAG: CPXCG motif-containing cysteine-rich protein [Gammaproteobacteria bacterium]